MNTAGLPGQRILVVEDEAMIAMLLEDFLEELGCVVVGPFGSVDHALASLEDQAIDAAIFDVNLRGERSYPIADWLASRDLPFLFITGYGQSGLDPGYRDRQVLQKPFTSDSLRQALQTLLRLGGEPG